MAKRKCSRPFSVGGDAHITPPPLCVSRSGGQSRPPLRSGYRWRSVRDVEDAVPYGQLSSAYRVYVEEV